ncbi:hypothetical protein LWI29_015488 [Acer saccharum]|uniref:Uncharacterized protein n=1 Tax=Acer saccharum TaxID=4024 RepID=A0AA39VV95_ACESA|nr:hypothetical protein LWI29_015488 [Acer saccharum]
MVRFLRDGSRDPSQSRLQGLRRLARVESATIVAGKACWCFSNRENGRTLFRCRNQKPAPERLFVARTKGDCSSPSPLSEENQSLPPTPPAEDASPDGQIEYMDAFGVSEKGWKCSFQSSTQYHGNTGTCRDWEWQLEQALLQNF